MKRKKRIIFLICIISAFMHASGGTDGKKIKTIVFEEMQIEGKIRRPQLILIKAEQRPKFSSMVMQSLDSDLNVNEFASDPVLEKSPYDGAFIFNGEEISNYKP